MTPRIGGNNSSQYTIAETRRPTRNCLLSQSLPQHSYHKEIVTAGRNLSNIDKEYQRRPNINRHLINLKQGSGTKPNQKLLLPISRVSTTVLGQKQLKQRSNLEMMRQELNRFQQVQHEVQRRREILNKVKESGRDVNDLELECMFENEELTENFRSSR